MAASVPARAEFLGEIGGEELRDLIAEHRGKVVVVNFWATWCGPCRVEFPHLKDLRRRFGPDELFLTGVSLDFDPKAPERFDAEHKPGYPLYYGGTDVPREFGVGAIPRTMIWAPDGTLAADHLGVATDDFLAATVNGFIEPDTREEAP